jgi:hypothetical protein
VSDPEYERALRHETANPLTRDICADESELAAILARALKGHPSPPPPTPPSLSRALQGNLSEFAVWDIGSRHWALIDRKMSWPANADSPWKASSSDGVDILSLVGADSQPVLVVIEVKSSTGNGSSLISGSGSTLQSDFDRLFRGPVQDRIFVSLGKVLTSLQYVHERPDLATAVKGLVGASPSECSSVQLAAVLVCCIGAQEDHHTRERAFARLSAHLLAAGWNTAQLTFRTIESEDIEALLRSIVSQSTS